MQPKTVSGRFTVPGIISLACLTAIVVILNTRLQAFLNFSRLGLAGAAGYLVLLFYHAAAFFQIAAHKKSLDPKRTVLTVILGILSLLSIAGQKVMFDEIAREIRLGWEVRGELVILHLGIMVNALFVVWTLMVFRSPAAARIKESGTSGTVSSD